MQLENYASGQWVAGLLVSMHARMMTDGSPEERMA
jgi:hypothetical protein